MSSNNRPSESSDSEDEQTALDEQLIAVMRKSEVVESEKLEEIKRLISKGADVNSRGSNGDTPLHIAVRKKEIHLVEFLISKDAIVGIVNGKNKTPLDIAIDSKQSEPQIVDILLAASNLATDIPRIGEFIEFFVTEFEAKLLSYHLASMGLEKKAGKFSDTFSKTSGQLLGGVVLGGIGCLAALPAEGAKVGALGGGIIGKGLGDMLGDKHHMKKVAKLANLTRQFVDNREDFRSKLVENGFDIFQSFEMQFMRVTTNEGSKYALHKLAKDAVNRAIDHFCITSDLSIAECVILGNSKIENVWGLPIPTPKLKSAGYEIFYEHEAKEAKWLTASLFEKAGMIIKKVNSTSYFIKKYETSKTNKYGHRRPLTKEVWEEIKGRYVKDDTLDKLEDLSKYRFVTNPANIQENSKIFLEKINSCDNKLGVDRLKKLIIENNNQILNELANLKEELNNVKKEIQLKKSVERAELEERAEREERERESARGNPISSIFSGVTSGLWPWSFAGGQAGAMIASAGVTLPSKKLASQVLLMDGDSDENDDLIEDVALMQSVLYEMDIDTIFKEYLPG